LIQKRVPFVALFFVGEIKLRVFLEHFIDALQKVSDRQRTFISKKIFQQRYNDFQ